MRYVPSDKTIAANRGHGRAIARLPSLSRETPVTTMNSPHAFVRRFESADQYAELTGLTSIGLSIRPRERFRASIARIDVGDIKVRRGDASAAVTLLGTTPDNHSFTFAMGPAPVRLLSGRQVLPTMLFHPRPADMLYATSPSRDPWPWGSIGIPYDALDWNAAVLAGRDISPSRIDALLVTPPEAARLRLLALVGDAARLAELSPDVADAPAAARALAGAITHALVDCLAGGDIGTERASVRRHHRIMARLERLVEEQPAAMLTLAEICAAVGAAQRTLNLVCHAFTGFGVVAYVRRRRLALVRQALLQAEPGRDSVGGIALDFGFWELGRFAAAYRAAFGELPSRTLQRRGSG